MTDALINIGIKFKVAELKKGDISLVIFISYTYNSVSW
jgi:hypothetical protein